MAHIDSGQQFERSDEQAVERYRYLLRTAPPELLERAHEEAFARLTPQQRQLALRSISVVTPEAEQSRLSEDPKALARAATRAEMRAPGLIERTLAPMGGGLFSSLAGAFIGSSIAHALFSDALAGQGDEAATDDEDDEFADDDASGDDDFGDFDADV